MDCVKQLDQIRLVFRLQRFAAEQRKPPDIIRSQCLKNLFHGLLCKMLAVVKIPALGIKAVLAVVAAAAHKQTDADAAAIGYIRGFDICIIQVQSLKNTG